MAIRHATLKVIKIGAYSGLIGTLVAVTLASIVAASGSAQITLKVQYDGPRALDLSECDGAAEALAACPIKVEILHPEDVFGSGYGYSSGYAYRFLEWLSSGYGYASYSQAVEEAGGTVTFRYSGLPVDGYVFRVYLDLDGEGTHTDGLEPLAFAEEAPGDSVLEVSLSQEKTGLVVLGEATATLTGSVLLSDAASPEGASVTAYGPVGDAYATTAGLDGTFTLDDVPTGLWYDLPYSIIVAKDGYLSAGADLDVPAGPLHFDSPFELVAQTVTVQLPLPAGWSMVSLPVVPSEATAASTFGLGTPVYAWDATGYRLLENADPLAPSLGYWVYASTATTVELTGVPFNPVPAELRYLGVGWHLIGGPSYAATIGEGAAGIEPPLYTWAATTGYEESETLLPGVGYWLLATDDEALVPLSEEGSS